jgi:hypothetical protein
MNMRGKEKISSNNSDSPLLDIDNIRKKIEGKFV